MTDISCRLIKGLFEYLDRTRLSKEDVVAMAGARVPNESLPTIPWMLNTKHRVSWNLFTAMLEVMDEQLPTGWETEYFEDDMKKEQPWVPHLKDMAALISSPLQMYRVINQLSGPSLFGSVVVPAMEVINAREIVLTLTIQEPHRDSPAFFRMSRTGMRIAPRALHLPDSHVQVEIAEKQARYHITMPVSQTLWARVKRGVKLAFSFEHFINELSQQERMFRENYAQLEKSETALRENRKVLEERVRIRTIELSRANELLAKQIEDIVASEAENRELQEKLIHLQKVEAIGTLASGISHEMNNVLQGMVLSLELAARNIPENSAARSPISVAQKFAARGRDVMKQLLGFSRKARSERAWIDVIATVRDSVDLIRSVIPQTVSIRQIYPPSQKPLTLYGDRTQIQQVIINLTSNAVYAMRATGGEIVIEVRDLGADCEIVVRDNGPGIAPEIQGHIFEPFYTTKPIGEGTGMGLSVVQGIVNSHLGRIDFSGAPQRGSEFKVTLPLSVAPAELNLDLDPEIDNSTLDDVSLSGGDETILVIDDEVDLTSVIADTLEIFGYTVLRAHNAQEGIAQLQENARAQGQKIGLILTDDSMPGLSGLELAIQLKEGVFGNFDIPVILMTGFDRHEPEDSIRSGAVRSFLRKPIDAVALNEAIRSTLDRALT